MKRDMEQPNKILIDEATKQILIDLIKTRNEIQGRLQLILQIYLNIKGVSGVYNLSPDCSELVKTPEVTITKKAEGEISN